MDMYFKIYKLNERTEKLRIEIVSETLNGRVQLLKFFKNNLGIVKESKNYIICGYETKDCCVRKASMVLQQWLLEGGLYRKDKKVENEMA